MIKIIDPVMITFFSLEIRWYGFLIVSALLISLFILNYLLKKEKKVNFEFFLDFIILAFPLGILGARLYYVVFNFEYYIKRPAKILAITDGGLAIHGGLIVGVIVLYLLARKRDKKILLALDYLAPLTAFSQSVGRWGNFVNQEAYGQIVSEGYYDIFPDFIKRQMYIEDLYREPTFLYESAADFMLFVFLLFYLRSDFKKDGEVFSLYLIFYSVIRFFIEEQRTDSLFIADFKVAKLISLVLIFIGLSLFYYIRKVQNSV
ncbi:prolipoprotein diacylglyceryl transferase [Halanaerobium saccharolyticum]|uniref:Phosphatidylglycerol--prolipoprotein diacylglyceryl transferase n=1 Tax=Halanaerobium saccharolyticum TaxID=43595 RepID=A0A4V3G4X5_9FIRM|nr:prolipoprotein diacylglyceryl transferase [Halanaerobium saccharolyticum]RAK07370.1 prolipoprotein diacylglyceryl transferase [Halanaerobium saccharolyticum]TDW02335.1 prolipoprotein diacylglyceryl transferase [Halanaerobium saccharolyticum]TDX59055.1 prolipoprotein diacylglyceryl transferase [Halanaerobium saccharolyticum]